ncbi:DUF2017 family protein [Cryobacterium psychrophilum]|uniref:DUF2017 family protein n=1 Tax=Cryobacterium psychrophilum TaxID=41988 RepID=A0A4Y8KWE6_9MICO|nr:DUF2017 family protein [Cryobacterium psychrophilum]TDW28642.1 uncharacterized protein DUF2017 [Cryobacterium psychrophilum]TFD82305.1 DUF2017 family protein [Cryobacterium psychrophilum]
MSIFGLAASGNLVGRFKPVEADLMQLAVAQLVDMLETAGDDVVVASADPVLRRMLPDAYPDDEEATAEFRRFTAGDLLAAKVFNARVVLATLRAALADTPMTPADNSPGAAARRAREPNPKPREPVTLDLDPEAVQSWLRTLNDLRLTLAQRLLISPDGALHLEDDEAPFLNELYAWVGMVQESLIYSIDI